MLKSKTLQSCYKNWQVIATPVQREFVDAVYAMCEEHYDAGGDTIVECFAPDEIIEEFTSLNDVKQYCGLQIEQALNTRWGEDDDPEVKRSERFKEW
jgi:hypothetical protein